MDYITAASGVISFLAMIAVALIAALYRSMISDQRTMLARIDRIEGDFREVKTKVENIIRDNDRESVLIERNRDAVGSLQRQMAEVILRLDRHGDDINAVSTRLNVLIRNGGGHD